LRKRPAIDNPQEELRSSTDDMLSHKGKKKCNRNFEPSWKQTCPWLRFIEGKMFLFSCVFFGFFWAFLGESLADFPCGLVIFVTH